MILEQPKHQVVKIRLKRDEALGRHPLQVGHVLADVELAANVRSDDLVSALRAGDAQITQ